MLFLTYTNSKVTPTPVLPHRPRLRPGRGCGGQEQPSQASGRQQELRLHATGIGGDQRQATSELQGDVSVPQPPQLGGIVKRQRWSRGWSGNHLRLQAESVHHSPHCTAPASAARIAPGAAVEELCGGQFSTPCRPTSRAESGGEFGNLSTLCIQGFLLSALHSFWLSRISYRLYYLCISYLQQLQDLFSKLTHKTASRNPWVFNRGSGWSTDRLANWRITIAMRNCLFCANRGAFHRHRGSCLAFWLGPPAIRGRTLDIGRPGRSWLSIGGRHTILCKMPDVNISAPKTTNIKGRKPNGPIPDGFCQIFPFRRGQETLTNISAYIRNEFAIDGRQRRLQLAKDNVLVAKRIEIKSAGKSCNNHNNNDIFLL